MTLVLANGTRRIVLAADRNVWEATVPGRVVMIINRDATGRVTRQSLQ